MRKIKQAIRISKIIFITLLLMHMNSATSQTQELKGRVYYLRIHDSLQPKILRGEKGEAIPVYASSSIFFNIHDYIKYPNAAEYADKMENFYLDQEKVYTERKVDTLGGLPVILLIRKDKSKENEFQQYFYIFDDRERTYEISISGFAMDKNIMDQYFQVTKKSFIYDTKKVNFNGVSMVLPVIMKPFNIGIWTNCYPKHEKVEMPVYANHLKDVKYEKKVKELDKYFKKLKPVKYKKETFNLGEMKVTKYSATYNKKFKTGSEPRSEYNYVIQHPSGGVFFIWYSGNPESEDILDIGMNEAIRSLVFL